ncbi:FecR family protein [Brevundimonas vesicularis]|uniref:DUF4880 domain-containing protein n=1 Tax=Brevundimonas vesicularis TaxID=41276 RepID=A0A1Z3U5B7_BREVE|nr:FecR domain-containing protein [Brevundimonas vesicularis]ASE38340.1 DUF4880 domain-containing protein [Brevundimonas vesicularis]MDX2333569.1 DUF4880 domain-containing protein [Brevundimonas vesicularis]
MKDRHITGLTPAMEAATEWFVRLHASPKDEAARPAFETWRAADPSHAAAYARIQRLWGASAHLPALVEAGVEPDRRAFLAGMAGVGGGVLMLAGAGRLALGPHPFSDYRTGAGETATIAVKDGVRVTLSTASALGVERGADRHRLRLLEGEAWVQTRAGRPAPLVVAALGGAVHVRGEAAFGLRVLNGMARLGVASGSVDLVIGGRPGRLTAGQATNFRRRGFRAAAPFDPSEFAWREGQLVFVNQPLTAVLAALDRWNGTRTWIRDGDLARQPVTLFGRTTESGQAVQRLAQAAAFTIERLGALIVVQPR